MLFIVHNPLLEVKIHEGKMFVLITNVCQVSKNGPMHV